MTKKTTQIRRLSEGRKPRWALSSPERERQPCEACGKEGVYERGEWLAPTLLKYVCPHGSWLVAIVPKRKPVPDGMRRVGEALEPVYREKSPGPPGRE